ncbi:MAG TPA: hypothetical protein VMI54_17480, partial [Polyangiaceae bacterium]|nr:hypothetical protein [Polyangiaceae bacterium]
MLNRSRRALVALLAPGLAGLVGACSQTTPAVAGVYHPTQIGVTPSDFLGNVPCATTDGALRSYVATVFDVEYQPDGAPVTSDDVAKGDAIVTTGDDYTAIDVPTPTCAGDATPGPQPRATVGFALPSSAPTDCQSTVAFSRVIDGHRYRAEVDGYDRADLVPLTPGAPILVDPTTGARVDPTWQWSCG